MENVTNKIDTIVFDLGGVLIDWNPRYLYSKIFSDSEQVEHFLEHICTFAWNAQQDAGRSLEDATNELLSKHPEFHSEIKAYYDRWEEMLNGSLPESVQLLQHFKQNTHYRLLALTNWSHQTFPRALELFDFLHWFEGIVVSGEEKLKKPDHALYHVLIDRYQLIPHETIFIDDSLPNVKAAQEIGMYGVHFQTPRQLREQLQTLAIEIH